MDQTKAERRDAFIGTALFAVISIAIPIFTQSTASLPATAAPASFGLYPSFPLE
jgi:hypothetical protein